MKKLLIFLRDNPALHIELAAHTDARGSDSHNMRLSQSRAQSVVNYLVNNGIARERMVAKGYGETQLMNRCANGVGCSEYEHQQNRRTEIKVLNG
ncbi:OmpA family protein [Paraflavitalea speifideaquila]|uniref:OmpA family protein n=1 Tax=Paraflavitalea speifideaquila TaxID=3076558 RepID=UPI0028E3F324|nr:OmpA family protein [Paraflavitalea speifideiaquila]